jgi:hypothetical protein
MPVVIGKTSQSAIVELQQAATNPFREGCAGQSRVVDGLACSLQDFLARMINPLVGLGIIAVSKYLPSSPPILISAFSRSLSGGSPANAYGILYPVLDVLRTSRSNLPSDSSVEFTVAGTWQTRAEARHPSRRRSGRPIQVSERPGFFAPAKLVVFSEC